MLLLEIKHHCDEVMVSGVNASGKSIDGYKMSRVMTKSVFGVSDQV